MDFKDIERLTRKGNWQCTYRLDYFTETIRQWEEREDLILNPCFQRGYDWTPEQQSHYVEYILKGGTVSNVIYLNRGAVFEDSDFVCVDGLQRTSAICGFLGNKVQAFGLYCNEFTGRIPSQSNVWMEININNLQTCEEVLQWYLDFNTGGTVHTKEELDKVRNMLLQNKGSIL